MSFLMDGPAGPAALANARAPIYLRAVVSQAGKIDVLDQLEDVPADDEAVHVYELVPGTEHGVALVRVQTRRHGTTCIPMAGGSYRHRADVDGEQLRESGAWRAWCRSQPVLERWPNVVDVTPRG